MPSKSTLHLTLVDKLDKIIQASLTNVRLGLVLHTIEIHQRSPKYEVLLMQRAFSETTSFLAALRVVWAAGLGTRNMQGTILFMEHP